MLGLATLTLVASALIGLAFPIVVRYMLDAAFVKAAGSCSTASPSACSCLFIVQALAELRPDLSPVIYGEQAVAGLRRELFNRLLDMPPGFFADRRTGELDQPAHRRHWDAAGVISHQIAEFSRQSWPWSAGIALLLMQPRLTLTALGVVPLVVSAPCSSGAGFGG